MGAAKQIVPEMVCESGEQQALGSPSLEVRTSFSTLNFEYALPVHIAISMSKE